MRCTVECLDIGLALISRIIKAVPDLVASVRLMRGVPRDSTCRAHTVLEVQKLLACEAAGLGVEHVALQ